MAGKKSSRFLHANRERTAVLPDKGALDFSLAIASPGALPKRTGVMFWEQEDLNPLLKQYAKKYLIDEGFLEKGTGNTRALT